MTVIATNPSLVHVDMMSGRRPKVKPPGRTQARIARITSGFHQNSARAGSPELPHGSPGFPHPYRRAPAGSGATGAHRDDDVPWLLYACKFFPARLSRRRVAYCFIVAEHLVNTCSSGRRITRR